MLKKKTKKSQEQNVREKYVNLAFQVLSEQFSARNAAIENLENCNRDLDWLLGDARDEPDWFQKPIKVQNYVSSFWTLEFEPYDSSVNLSCAIKKKDVVDNPSESHVVNTTVNQPSILNFDYADCCNGELEEDINLSLILVNDVYYVFDTKKFVKEEDELK
jgi:hypothetical protein